MEKECNALTKALSARGTHALTFGILLVTLSGFLASSASAGNNDATSSLQIISPFGSPSVTNSNPVSYTGTISLDGGTARSVADLSTGTLKAYAAAPSIDPNIGGGTYLARADTWIQDNVYFSPGASGVGYLQFHWDGNLSSYDGLAASAAELNINIYNANIGDTDTDFLLNNDECSPYGPNVTCVVGTSIDQTVSVPFVISSGATTFFLELFVQAADGQVADFSDTASFAFSLPDGVTYTSDSNVFLADAAPIGQTPASGVPEPGVLSLLGCGMLVAITRRRNRLALALRIRNSNSI